MGAGFGGGAKMGGWGSEGRWTSEAGLIVPVVISIPLWKESFSEGPPLWTLLGILGVGP